MFRKTIILMATLALALAPFEDTLDSSAENKRSIVKEDFKLSTENIPYGGTLVIGDSNQPTLINPVLTDHSISASVVSLVFNGLVRITPSGEMEPDLAVSWDISEDGLVYTFSIREGVKFHDGAQLTAEDIVFSYQQIQNPDVKSPYFKDFEIIEKFEALDKHTFRVFLKTASASVLVKFAKRMVLPRHLFKDSAIYQNPRNYSPVGTGPFKFKKWEGDQIVLEANEEYFEGRPYLDKIVFKTYSNRSEVWSAFMRQEVDLVRFMSVEDYEVTKKDSAFQTFAQLTSMYYTVLYNLQDPILSNKSIRQAISYAIDRQSIIERIEGGYGSECLGPFSRESWGFNDKVESYSYDPAKALLMLSESGWKDMNEDGILEKDGQKFIIRLLVDSRGKKLRKLAMMLRQQLQEFGIEVQIKLYDDDETLVRQSVGAQAQLRMEFGGAFDPDETAKLWHSSKRSKTRLWANSDESASAIDELIRLGQTTQEREARKKIYNDLHAKIYEQQPACFLYHPSLFHAAGKNIGNADLFLNARMPDYVLKDFYLDPNVGGGDHSGDNQ